MVLTCCFVPSTAQVCDEEVEKGKQKKESLIRWKRNKTKTKSKSSSKKKIKKESKKEKSKKSKKSEKKEKQKHGKEEESEEEEEFEVEPTEEETEELELRLDIDSTSSDADDFSVGDRNENRAQGVFREPDALSLKSDSLPASLPKSILAESFYSDDSLDNGDLTFEVDYRTSTPLFEALELNDWGNVLFFLRAGKFFSSTGTLVNCNGLDKPETQVRTWVHCQDESGEMMWRQLPLHAAICFAAPLVVIQRLVELYPDALACPDNFGNLPLNLAAKIHGTHSYIFQVVSVRSQRWLQTRQDYDDDHDESTVGTRDLGLDRESFDRPHTPAMFERPITPTSPHTRQLQAKRGLEPSGTSSRPYVEMLESSYDDTYSSDDDDEGGMVETEYKMYRDRNRLGLNESSSFGEVCDVTRVYG
jgi:hypothetical protein